MMHADGVETTEGSRDHEGGVRAADPQLAEETRGPFGRPPADRGNVGGWVCGQVRRRTRLVFHSAVSRASRESLTKTSLFFLLVKTSRELWRGLIPNRGNPHAGNVALCSLPGIRQVEIQDAGLLCSFWPERIRSPWEPRGNRPLRGKAAGPTNLRESPAWLSS